MEMGGVRLDKFAVRLQEKPQEYRKMQTQMEH